MPHVGQGTHAITPIGWAGFGTPEMGKYLTATVNANGELVFTLTQAGVLACGSSSLEGYFRVMGNDGGEHVVQIYLPQNANVFLNPSFQSQYGDDAWYDGHRIQGETHYGGADYVNYFYPYNITSSDKDDTIRTGRVWSGSGIAAATIDAGKGDDTIHTSSVSAGSMGSVTINGGEGDDQIFCQSEELPGTVGASRGSLTIDGGKGNDNISIGGNAQATNSGTVTIDGGEGNDNINIGTAVFAVSSGTVTIDGGEGNDNINIGYEVFAGRSNAPGGTVTIDGGKGNDNINIEYDVFAVNSGAVTIDGGGGHDIMRIGGSIDTGGGAVTIDGGDGIDALFLDSFTSHVSLDALLSAGTVQNMEILVGGGDFSNVHSLADMGITINGAGKIGMGGDWTYVDSDNGRAHYTYTGTDPDYGGIIASVEMNALAGGG
jgi:hypothetical protein